ncbi:MAG: sodium:calcium antiporter [Candidatus Niyogibacteria bacterium]|nr:sodium:calcium antiporter [Candidatus Niyogibacteria bacterium]
MAIPLLVFIGSFFVLARSSVFLVSSLTNLARILHLSEYLVAFILMSFATSVSELFIGVSSALDGVPRLSLGNILGANLLNITIVIGVSAIIARGLSVESKISRKNFWLIFFLSLLPFLLGVDGVISRADGFALLVTFFIYIWHVLEEREYFTKVINNRPATFAIVQSTVRDLAVFGAATIALLLSSWAVVWAGERIAESLSFGLVAFGALFVALGTTMPELTVGVRAALSNRGALAVGNALGSVAFNATFIVGLVSIIHPIAIRAPDQSLTLIGAFVAAFILFNLFLYRDTTISRAEGLALAGVYGAFVIVEYFLL